MCGKISSDWRLCSCNVLLWGSARDSEIRPNHLTQSVSRSVFLSSDAYWMKQSVWFHFPQRLNTRFSPEGQWGTVTGFRSSADWWHCGIEGWWFYEWVIRMLLTDSSQMVTVEDHSVKGGCWHDDCSRGVCESDYMLCESRISHVCQILSVNAWRVCWDWFCWWIDILWLNVSDALNI